MVLRALCSTWNNVNLPRYKQEENSSSYIIVINVSTYHGFSATDHAVYRLKTMYTYVILKDFIWHSIDMLDSKLLQSVYNLWIYVICFLYYLTCFHLYINFDSLSLKVGFFDANVPNLNWTYIPNLIQGNKDQPISSGRTLFFSSSKACLTVWLLLFFSYFFRKLLITSSSKTILW